ncbi:PKD domain-containing protein [Chitinophaga barathri]|uniref:PKD domain-containing protein n=1 Tax=Chitinophaga barathri TaxID=1647451 RepID=A0A3N4MIE3_9BACT|nr:PKD domain-containing protein [Chitinophaga barathri]RPD41826.1 hypothetical protein EG028_06580 [Chitinophaga barathri]
MKSIVYIAAASVLFAACSPDSEDLTLGAKPTVSFTAALLPTNPNKVALQNTTTGAFAYTWFNGGASPVSYKKTDTLTFTKKGEYTVSLVAYGAGGSSSVSQKVTIAQDMPGVDILKGGNMEAGSEAHWTVLNTGGPQTAITFTGGKLKFVNQAGGSNGGIYQELTVKKDVGYTLSANLKGGGANETWFEVIIGTTAPAQGSDYSGTKMNSINTWAGCGIADFDGELAAVGCDGLHKDGKITFATAGKIYLLIKGGCGGAGTFGPNGVTIDDVKFVEAIQ